MAELNKGDRVHHKMHGDGEVVSLSSGGGFAVVKYQTAFNDKHYYRTHAVLNLKKIESALVLVVDSSQVCHTRSTCTEFHGPALGSVPAGKVVVNGFTICAECE